VSRPTGLKKDMFHSMANTATVLPSARSLLHGIGFMLFMTLCFSSLDASAKYISSELPLFVVVWGRYVFHFLFVTLFFFRGAPGSILYTRRLKLQILRSVLLVGSGVSLGGALMYLPLADCTIISFASPLLVTALSFPLLGESVGMHRWGVVIFGLFGTLLVIRPGMGIFHWASILPLVTAFFYANMQITTRILGRTDHPLTTLFYSSTGGLLVSSMAVFFVWVTPSPEQWLVLVWLGFLGAVGHYFMIKAFEIAPASLLVPFDYVTLIWAMLLGFFLFRDLPDGWTIAGAAVIITSGLYLIKHERRLAAA
jgi:drug/metabolite transporter (DMT)-like permease